MAQAVRKDEHTMLTAEQVTKRYGKNLANQEVNLTVPDGEIHVLLGPNGAGKSTLLKCVVGLLRFKGKVTIDGFDNRSLDAKHRIGYIPEIPALYPLLTVWEHLEFISRAYDLKNWESLAQSLLERLEMWDKKEKFGSDLSKGMQQKLSVCCALLPQPRCVVFDEPLVGLDPHAIKELKLITKELAASGASVLISTHMIDSVEENWDGASIMMGARIRRHCTKTQLEQQGETLEEAFFAVTEGGTSESSSEDSEKE